MVVFIGMVLSIALLVFGIADQRRIEQEISGNRFVAIGVLSGLLGMAIGTVALPSAWVVTATAFRGGPLESNLFPGSGTDTVLASLVIGSLVAVVEAMAAYGAYVFGRRPETPSEGPPRFQLRSEDLPGDGDE